MLLTDTCCTVLSRSVMSNSLRVHRLQPARLLCPWGFSRQEYWSGLPYILSGDLSDPGIKPKSPTLQADSLPSKPPEDKYGDQQSKDDHQFHEFISALPSMIFYSSICRVRSLILIKQNGNQSASHYIRVLGSRMEEKRNTLLKKHNTVLAITSHLPEPCHITAQGCKGR